MKLIPRPFSRPATAKALTRTVFSSLLSLKSFKFAKKYVFALSGKNLVSWGMHLQIDRYKTSEAFGSKSINFSYALNSFFCAVSPKY